MKMFEAKQWSPTSQLLYHCSRSLQFCRFRVIITIHSHSFNFFLSSYLHKDFILPPPCVSSYTNFLVEPYIEWTITFHVSLSFKLLYCDIFKWSFNYFIITNFLCIFYLKFEFVNFGLSVSNWVNRFIYFNFVEYLL